MKEYMLHLIVGHIKLHFTECCFMGFCYYVSPLLVRHIRAILVLIDNDILTRIFARNVLCIPLLLIGRQPPLHIVIAVARGKGEHGSAHHEDVYINRSHSAIRKQICMALA